MKTTIATVKNELRLTEWSAQSLQQLDLVTFEAFTIDFSRCIVIFYMRSLSHILKQSYVNKQLIII